MSEQKERTAYIGIIHNENFDSRTLVMAVDETEAMDKVLEKVVPPTRQALIAPNKKALEIGYNFE